MKPVHIEFVEKRGWRVIGAFAVAICLVLLGALGWRWTQLHSRAMQESDRIAALQVQLQKARTPIQARMDPRQASAEQAAQLLQQDLNKVFVTAENLNEPGVRLRGMTLDNTAGVLRLEYDLDSIVKASVVTEALNAGYENRPWQLEGVSGSAGNGLAGNGSVMQMVPTATVFRGVWVARLKNL